MPRCWTRACQPVRWAGERRPGGCWPWTAPASHQLRQPGLVGYPAARLSPRCVPTRWLAVNENDLAISDSHHLKVTTEPRGQGGEQTCPISYVVVSPRCRPDAIALSILTNPTSSGQRGGASPLLSLLDGANRSGPDPLAQPDGGETTVDGGAVGAVETTVAHSVGVGAWLDSRRSGSRNSSRLRTLRQPHDSNLRPERNKLGSERTQRPAPAAADNQDACGEEGTSGSARW